MEKILQNKKIIVGLVVSLLLTILLSIFFVFLSKKHSKDQAMTNEKVESPFLPDGRSQNLSQVMEELKMIEVPEPEKLVSDNIQSMSTSQNQNPSIKTEEEILAIPEEAVPASADQSEVKLRTFNLQIRKNKIVPREIRVYVGDVVEINVTAVDKNYDLQIPEYGLKTQVGKGESSVIQFQASQPGKFILLCSLCSPPVNGSLLVKPRDL
ncbi:MAG: cupredoxin domain-containing protein [Patescibacteria group bacterium]|nr:cupredoxin domain-containing protein [Patescibacteria group bacterium]